MILRENKANAGHFSTRRQKKHEKTASELPKKKIETLKGSQGLKTYLQVWEVIFSNRKKGNQFVITEKNNEPNQKSTEIVFNKNAKMVSKSLNIEGNSLKPFQWWLKVL